MLDRILKIKFLLLFFVVSFTFPASIQAEDDFQYRSLVNIKLIDTKNVDLYWFSQVRFGNDAKDVGFYMFGPRLKFDFWKHLQLALHYSYLNFKVNNPVAGRSEFKFNHRIEVEVNPRWTIDDWLKIFFNNRIEFRWIEDKGSHNTRYRPKIQLEFPLKNLGRLKAFYVNSEFFYNIAENEYNENWTVPIGLKFKLNDKMMLSTFYMIQHLKRTETWSSNQILGTFLNVKF